MAETFVAVRRGPADFEQRVCLKLILPGRAEDPRFLEQFRDEARLLAHLRYAGIVQVHDFGEADGTHYMALELVDGVDLEKLISLLRVADVQLPTQIALYVAAEVLAALHHAHTLHVDGEPLHIVHRDISPSNVLLSRHGEVKLTDFGIAKFSNRRHRTQSGHVKGKIAYMSPEQVRGDELDARSDLFTVGVVLHEMLTGIHPFEAATEINLLSNILTGNRKPTRELLPSAAPELVAVIDALLATEADHRPQSASDALRALPLSEPSFVLKRGLEELISALELPPLRTFRSTTLDGEVERSDELGIAPTELQRRSAAPRGARRSTLWMLVLALVASAGGYWGLQKLEPSHAAMPPNLPTPGVRTANSQALATTLEGQQLQQVKAAVAAPRGTSAIDAADSEPPGALTSSIVEDGGRARVPSSKRSSSRHKPTASGRSPSRQRSGGPARSDPQPRADEPASEPAPAEARRTSNSRSGIPISEKDFYDR